MSIANNNVAFKSITTNYVHGTDAKNLSDDQLIGAIKGLESEIKDLGTVETKSTKIDAKIKELGQMKDEIVALLDSRS